MSLTAIKDSPAAKARAALLSTASKKLPAKTVYPAIIRLHAGLDGETKEVRFPRFYLIGNDADLSVAADSWFTGCSESCFETRKDD